MQHTKYTHTQEQKKKSQFHTIFYVVEYVKLKQQ